jgi:hypothetical protein
MQTHDDIDSSMGAVFNRWDIRANIVGTADPRHHGRGCGGNGGSKHDAILTLLFNERQLLTPLWAVKELAKCETWTKMLIITRTPTETGGSGGGAER